MNFTTEKYIVAGIGLMSVQKNPKVLLTFIYLVIQTDIVA